MRNGLVLLARVVQIVNMPLNSGVQSPALDHKTTFLLTAACAVLAGSLQSAALVQPTRHTVGAVAKQKVTFETDILPLLGHYCYGCHGEKKKGGLDLRIYRDRSSAVRDKQVFEKVMKNLEAHEMPPEKKPQPTPDERDLITAWIESEIFKCDCDHPDPGRVTLRRLNRAEYNNTIHDLIGVSFQPADDFPADDVGYGFDNIGDVLSLPPILLEKYMAAAGKILDTAIVTDFTPKPLTKHFDAVLLDGTAPGGPTGDNMRLLSREGDIHVTCDFPREGEYVLRARAYGEQAGPEPARMAFSIEGKEIKRFDVTAEQFNPAIYEIRIRLTPGKKQLAASYLNNYVNLKDPDPAKRGDRNLVIDYLELVAPPETTPPPLVLPDSHKRIFICQPSAGQERECARVILSNIVRRAYRRPAASEEIERLVNLAEQVRAQETNFERGIQVALQAVLVSPNFLFRGELPQAAVGRASYAFSGVRPSSGAETRERAAGQRISSALDDPQLAAPEDGRTPLNGYQASRLPAGRPAHQTAAGGTTASLPAAVPIGDYALASRLSYFLWSSMPDDELFAQAERGTLRKNLTIQVKRMLKDAKGKALVENFAGQWLQIRNLSQTAPDKATYPDFDDALRAAMQQETELFFETIVREDRSVLQFIDADYTFLNERLARHYGVKGVKGDSFQRVALKGTQRGGVLAQASVLTVTSNPTRTSPVKRGKWVLENLLGTPPPPPPPDVPELKEGKQAALTGSLRQRMEQHRVNPLCASCHARMDPIGFGLENYDGIGAWREKDGSFAIDPAGQLVTGERFRGPRDLKAILLNDKREDFIRCLSEKMLTYALGRGLEYYDRCAAEQIAKGLAKHRYRFSSLVLEIARSAPFQMRRGEAETVVEAVR